MLFLFWCVALGMVGGGFSGKLMTGSSHGRIVDISMGLGGAIVIGIWSGSIGRLGSWGFVYASVSALLGAVLLTVLTAFINGRKYA